MTTTPLKPGDLVISSEQINAQVYMVGDTATGAMETTLTQFEVPFSGSLVVVAVDEAKGTATVAPAWSIPLANLSPSPCD